ncbi:HAD-IA family hydrolase [Candidatus Woesearchaeota archaeon]|nr:HAD-IA family hydrolase [Candidatus Woesearchaeota archaeon]
MNTKCILFDVDGVVITKKRFSIPYSEKYGIEEEKMLPFFKGPFLDCVVGKADLKKVIAPYLAGWNFDGTVDEFLEFWFHAENNPHQELLRLVGLLRSLGVKCFLVTNQEKYRADYLRHEMNFSELFDGMFSSCDLGVAKPHSAFYEHVFSKLNTLGYDSEEKVLFFDDTSSNVEAAGEFGFAAYKYTTFEEFVRVIEGYFPDVFEVVQSFNEESDEKD